ncbi:MAG TPA: hypothetical protein PK900_08085, partial [Spirochaetota bacterium]|nr:hypothetical protein [Spirochaetota bacterium]
MKGFIVKYLLIMILLIFSVCCKKETAADDDYLENLLKISKKAILDELKEKKYDKKVDSEIKIDSKAVFISVINKNIDRNSQYFFSGDNYNYATEIASINAAFFDDRHGKINESEMNDYEIEVHVIDKLEIMSDFNDYEYGADSLY